MSLSKFKIGFALGYVVATIRRSKDADPLIQRLKQGEEKFSGWWKGLSGNHVAKKVAKPLTG